jgi:hypothetical protein
MAMHFPSNHSLRPLYRALALITGLFMLVLGVLGYLKTAGEGLFETGDWAVLGLKVNPAFSYASIASGTLVIVATLIGRNVDRFVYLWAGVGHLLIGTAMLLLMGDPATNYLNFTIVTCIVSYLIGSVLATAGMYSKVQRAQG